MKRSARVSVPTLYQDDWFFALRLAWNNAADTALLAGRYQDVHSAEGVWRLEFSHRLTHRWAFAANLTAFTNVRSASPLAPIRRDGHLSLTLTHHFRP